MTIRAIDLQRLVNLYGEPLRLVKNFFGQYNPQTGQNDPDPNPQEVDFIGYMAMYDLSDIDNVNILRGDRKLILGSRDSQGDTIDPEIGDEVVGQGDVVSIVSVGKVMSSGVVICYICQVRE